jgi:HK97 gp10 family phage protein
MATRKPINREATKALRFEGMEAVLAKLANVVDKVTGKAAKEVFLAAGIKLRDGARARVPVRTGKLKKAIFASRGDENKPNVLVGVNYKIAPHAHLVEYGTVRTHPHPYLRPALAVTAAEMRQIIEGGLRRIIQEASNGRH